MSVCGRDGGNVIFIGDGATDNGAISDDGTINRAFDGTAAVVIAVREGDGSINNGCAEGGKMVSSSGGARVGSSELSSEANFDSMKNLRNGQESR